MAEPFRPNLPTNINNGEKYKHGDGLQPETINQVIEALYYVLGLTGQAQTTTDAGNTRVEIVEDVNGYPRFKFYNIKGSKGDNGDPGVGIASITNQYATNNTSISAPEKWYVNPIAPTSTMQFAWIKQTITFTDGRTQEISPYVYGVAGKQGEKGEKGETGLRFVSLNKNATGEEIYYNFVGRGEDILNVELPFGLWLSGVDELSAYTNNAVFLMHGASFEDSGTQNKHYSFYSVFTTPDFVSYRIIAIVTISNDPTQCTIETSVTGI